MSDEQQPLNPSSSDHIEAHIGDGARDVLVGKGITSVRAGERGVTAGDQIRDSVIITGDHNQVITQRLDPKDAKNQRNHAVMRQLVRKFWIDGVLKSSLYNEVLIRLNLQEQSDKVDNRPWNLIQRQPGQDDRLLPLNTPIIDVFDQMNQLLLILGEPGSGKTTSILELTRDLLVRAEAKPTHPTPVVFNLSSWSQHRQTLADWLIDELQNKYSIPKRVAKAWVEEDELLPLLDGLDEVQQEHRNACVMAINTFRQEHLVSMAVCSRTTEYEDLATRLRLQGAVLVRPLTSEQIHAYLNISGPELVAVHTAIQQDKELQQLAESPLMLSIMSLAYQGVPANEIASANSSQTRRQHLFDAYIEHMFGRREDTSKYNPRQTIYWLQWLASHLVQHGQTIFLIEDMQPSWLSNKSQLWVYGLLSRIVMWTTIAPFTILGVLSLSLPVLQFALGFAAIGLGETFATTSILASTTIRSSKLYRIGVCILCVGSFVGIYALFFWKLTTAVAGGITAGFVYGLFKWTIDIFEYEDINNHIKVVERFHFAKIRFIVGISVGLFIGLFIGFVVNVLDIVQISLDSKILYELGIIKLDGIWSILLLAGLIGSIMGGSLGGVSSDVADIKLSPNQGIKLSIRNALFSCISGTIIASLILAALGQQALGTLVGAGLFAWNGGRTVIKHIVLRLIFWKYKHIPWNYAHFLNYAAERLFLRKVGGGYIFIHRMLMEHFASLTDADIKHLAAEVEASRS